MGIDDYAIVRKYDKTRRAARRLWFELSNLTQAYVGKGNPDSSIESAKQALEEYGWLVKDVEPKPNEIPKHILESDDDVA